MLPSFCLLSAVCMLHARHFLKGACRHAAGGARGARGTVRDISSVPRAPGIY